MTKSVFNSQLTFTHVWSFLRRTSNDIL